MNSVRKQLLLLAAVLILVIAVPTVVAALTQSQSIHVSGTYNPPQTPNPTVKFSYWFPNGTAMPATLSNLPIPVINEGQAGYQFIVIVRNDGNVPIQISGGGLQNQNLPSNIVLRTGAAQYIGGGIPIPVGSTESTGLTLWFQTQGTYTPGASFTYSFDFVLTIIAENNPGAQYPQAIHVIGTTTYPTSTGSPTSVSLSLSPNPVSVGSSVTCTATLSGSNPTGTITWSSSSSTGHFSSTLTTLTSGTSITTYTDTSSGQATITASYSGDSNNEQSSGTNTLTINPFSPSYFSIFWITDTQFLSEPENSQYFNSLTSWIVNNIGDGYNLQMVVHTGDIIQDGGGPETLPNPLNTLPEWADANTAMSTLMDNKIPYCWDAGNHDYYLSLVGSQNVYYGNKYAAFDPSKVSQAEPNNWVGSTPDGENTAVKINYMDRNFLIINLEWNAPESVFTSWVDPLLSNYSKYQIIIATHAYMDPNGTIAPQLGSTPYPDQRFYDNLSTRVENNPNIFLTLNGHFDTAQGYASIGSPTRLMYDLQGQQPNPAGAEAVTILKFDLTSNTIQVKTYSVANQSFSSTPFTPYTTDTLTLPLPSLSSTRISNGAAIADNIATTGVKISVSGSSAADGTGLIITTSNFGATVPSSSTVGALQLNGAIYYDVRVQGISDGMATVSIVVTSGQNMMQYWNGAQWITANNIIVSGNTVTGSIPVVALTGTPIALTSTSIPTPTPSSTTQPTSQSTVSTSTPAPITMTPTPTPSGSAPTAPPTSPPITPEFPSIVIIVIFGSVLI
jgi:hypothetical protein